MQGRKAEQTDEIALEAEDSGVLPAKQELALRAVISHPTLKEAALAAGVSETTLWRYMQDDNFKRLLREARRESINHSVIRLQRASSDAVTVLHELMISDKAPASARITAARTILDYSMRAAEIDELVSRVEELEDFIRKKKEEDELDSVLDNEED